MVQSVVYPMYFSFRTAVRDCALLWYSQLYILCILVFALRCWTVPYYGTVSCVYYVFLDIPLIWACRLLCKIYLFSSSTSRY